MKKFLALIEKNLTKSIVEVITLLTSLMEDMVFGGLVLVGTLETRKIQKVFNFRNNKV